MRLKEVEGQYEEEREKNIALLDHINQNGGQVPVHEKVPHRSPSARPRSAKFGRKMTDEGKQDKRKQP